MTKPDIGKDHKVVMTSCWKDEHGFWLPGFIRHRGRPGTLHLVVDIEIYKEGEEDGKELEEWEEDVEERDFPDDGKERYLCFPPDMFELEEAEASAIKDGIFLITIPKVVE